MKRVFFLACFFLFFCAVARQSAAEDIEFSGSAGAGFTAYTEDFDSYEDMKAAELGNIFFGTLNLRAAVADASAVMRFKIKPVFDGVTSPVRVDEAYARAHYGDFSVEGGARKLTWGKADSMGPLDVINPLDYSDLSNMTDIAAIKIARPLLRVSYNFAAFTKLEAVFVPWFRGHEFALDGRWTPSQMKELAGFAKQAAENQLAQAGVALPPSLLSQFESLFAGSATPNLFAPGTVTLEYAQTGIRFTASIGQADVGAQYYFGRLPRPSYDRQAMQNRLNSAQPLDSGDPVVLYNYYHHAGLDYAQVLWGFNTRAEFAANITKDTGGTDPAIYNPHLAWSVGFDRGIFDWFDFNAQVTQIIRLHHDKIAPNGDNDVEAALDVTSTRITFFLSRKLFRDALEIKFACIWGIEDSDCYLIPALEWTKGDVQILVAAGVFAGAPNGELGQYSSNCYLKTSITYSF
jgi:hypothetical protein